MVARLEIYAPNAPTKNPAIIDEFVAGSENISTLDELGGLANNGFTDGAQDLSNESRQPRLYTINSAGDRNVGALVAYYKHLQLQGDAGLALPAQKGLIYCRDYAFQIHELETNLYQRVATGDSTTELIGTETFRCGFEFPCYLLFGGQIKRLLGDYGEQFEFAILERVDQLESEITTQQSGTIRIAWGTPPNYTDGFIVDFLKLQNPYIREAIVNPEIDYSLRQNQNISDPLYGTYKQQWAISADITLAQLKDLRSLLSAWRNDRTSNITLTDLTSEIAEPTPRTRAIATGAEEIINGNTRYFGSFNVGQHEGLSVSPKEGDSSRVIVAVTFRELGASA